MPLKIQRQIVQQGFERVNRRARKRVELVYKESLRNPVTPTPCRHEKLSYSTEKIKQSRPFTEARTARTHEERKQIQQHAVH